jgi:SMC interacting uncharacterized protein involved in chromosome segregation
MVKKDFTQFLNDEKLACILMNNIQQLRVQLRKLSTSMSGNEELDEKAKKLLEELQKDLQKDLQKLAAIFTKNLIANIHKSILALGSQLAKVKGKILYPGQKIGESERQNFISKLVKVKGRILYQNWRK